MLRLWAATAAAIAFAFIAGDAGAQTGKVTIVTSFAKDVTDPFKKAFEAAHPGATLEVQCRSPGYRSGKVLVTFDGQPEHEVALCVLQRIKICVDNIKNSFDDCELDPNKP